MGRLTKSTGRPSFRNHYSKLVDDYPSPSCDVLKFMPALPEYLSYCCHQCGHTQKLQAEELNIIIGNAFRMGYAAQLQKQHSLQDVIKAQVEHKKEDKIFWEKGFSFVNKNNGLQMFKKASSDMDVHLSNKDTTTIKLVPPSSIPGLTHKFNVLEPPEKSTSSQQSRQSTPGSEESNSPTEMNTYKKMNEKPPLIKRIAMGLTGTSHSTEDDSCLLVNEILASNSPSSPSNRPLSGGYVNENITEGDTKYPSKQISNANIFKNDIVENISSNLKKHLELGHTILSKGCVDSEIKPKRISQISSSSSSSCPLGNETNTVSSGYTPPPLPERTDSLNNKEEGELRLAPWFQAGIPREIALEILAQEPIGAFMVRESTSKSGCFALSLRVPRTFQPTGIAHYLIVRTNKGYKIKGFTKEFSTLSSLITHHSVMPELLPCPLSLNRYHPTFGKSDSKKDFADIDLDSDYNALADFRKMMADLNV